MKLLNKWFGGSTRVATPVRPRVVLACDELGQRINPTWIPFTITLTNSVVATGGVEFNSAHVGTGWQQVAITDFGLFVGQQALQYEDVVGTVDFINGVFQGMTIQAEFGDAEFPGDYTGVAVNWTEGGISDHNWDNISGTVSYGAQTIYRPF